MGKAYSDALRQKGMSVSPLAGMSQSKAAQSFQSSRHTLDLWLERQAVTGEPCPATRTDRA